MHGHSSIWFFSGILLLSYGILITVTGLWEFWHPPAHQPVLYHLHASIWWGGMMTVAGIFYIIRFHPRKGEF